MLGLRSSKKRASAPELPEIKITDPMETERKVKISRIKEINRQSRLQFRTQTASPLRGFARQFRISPLLSSVAGPREFMQMIIPEKSSIWWERIAGPGWFWSWILSWWDKIYSLKRAKFWKLILGSIQSRITSQKSQPMNPLNVTSWFETLRRGSRISIVPGAIVDFRESSQISESPLPSKEPSYMKLPTEINQKRESGDQATEEYQGRHNLNVVQRQDTPTQYKWTFRWWLRRL